VCVARRPRHRSAPNRPVLQYGKLRCTNAQCVLQHLALCCKVLYSVAKHKRNRSAAWQYVGRLRSPARFGTGWHRICHIGSVCMQWACT
jgi:hypothetical protein